jgi:hypothetical protein
MRPWRTARTARTIRHEATPPPSGRTRQGPLLRGTPPISRRYRTSGTAFSSALASVRVAGPDWSNIEFAIFLAHREYHEQGTALRIATDRAKPDLPLVWIARDERPRVIDQGFDFMHRNSTGALFPIAIIPIELAHVYTKRDTRSTRIGLAGNMERLSPPHRAHARLEIDPLAARFNQRIHRVLSAGGLDRPGTDRATLLAFERGKR